MQIIETGEEKKSSELERIVIDIWFSIMAERLLVAVLS